jgi:hypothetical protein
MSAVDIIEPQLTKLRADLKGRQPGHWYAPVTECAVASIGLADNKTIVEEIAERVRVAGVLLRGEDVTVRRVAMQALKNPRRYGPQGVLTGVEEATKSATATSESVNKVAAEAPRAESPSSAKSGTTHHWDVEPHDQPVTTADVLDLIQKKANRHLVLPKHADIALALWVAHTWVYDVFDHTPYLNAKSPTKRCGKTTLLNILYYSSLRGELAANITAASAFRVISEDKPSLLIDEGDSFLNEKDDRRGILNSGHSRNGYVLRYNYEKRETERLSVFGPKAIASIGAIPETLTDRSIVIPMQRKPKDAKVERLAQRDSDDFVKIRRYCARWSNDNVADLLKAADPAMPKGLNDRAEDCWRPLLAIADRAGEKWARLARDAAQALSGEEVNDDEGNVGLLADIRDVWPEHRDVLLTKELVTLLVSDTTKPWAEMGRARKPLTDRILAKMLEGFFIYSRTVHPPGLKHGKGYIRRGFEHATSIYLPQNHATTESQDSQACEHANGGKSSAYAQNASVQEDLPHAHESWGNPSESNELHSRTLAKPEDGVRGDLEADGPGNLDQDEHEAAR